MSSSEEKAGMTIRGLFYAVPLALALWAIIGFFGYYIYTGLRYWL